MVRGPAYGAVYAALKSSFVQRHDCGVSSLRAYPNLNTLGRCSRHGYEVARDAEQSNIPRIASRYQQK